MAIRAQTVDTRPFFILGATKFTHVEVRKWLLSTCFLSRPLICMLSPQVQREDVPRCYISLNIHKGIGYKFSLYFDLDLLTFVLWQGTQPAVVQLFPRYSVYIYKCTNASKLVWAGVHVSCKNYEPHLYVATELPLSWQQACFINVEVWLVTLTDGSAYCIFVVKEWHWGTIYHPPPARLFGTFFAGHYCIFYNLTHCTHRCCLFTCDLLFSELHNSYHSLKYRCAYLQTFTLLEFW